MTVATSSAAVRAPALVTQAGVSLRELLPDATFHAASDPRATSCCCDSRDCLPGDLFAALVGTDRDGHEFIADAIGRGASAILSERPVPTAGLPNYVVSNSREAYGHICQALVRDPSRRVRVIGVTGTNGKTTTSWLIASVFKAAGLSVGVMGTLGYFDGIETLPATLTTPEAHVIARWLARTEANACSHAVMEVSSHALSQYRVAGMQFDAGCVTNVRRDHLDYHGSLANYRAAKARLFKHLAPDGLVVLNADDPVCASYAGELTGPVLTVGLTGGELSANVVERFAGQQTFLLSAGDETAAVRTRLIGDHHVANCLVAAAIGLAYGIDLQTVVRGLEGVVSVPGRMQLIDCGQPFPVVVDYAHTPDALAAVLRTLREVTPGRLICVFGAGGERDRRKRPLMAQAVERSADLAIVTTDNPRGENPRRILADLRAGFSPQARLKVIADRQRAIHEALSQAEEGDGVLIAGKGHETYQIIGNGYFDFDDRQVARDWLRRRFPSRSMIAACN